MVKLEGKRPESKELNELRVLKILGQLPILACKEVPATGRFLKYFTCRLGMSREAIHLVFYTTI
jgi:hypothetical protein